MTADRPATIPEIATAVASILAKHGPMTDDELLDALPLAGIELGVGPLDTLDHVLSLDDVGLVITLDDERHAHLPTLLDGRVLTHRLTASEIDHDLVAVVPDLEPFSLLIELESFTRLDEDIEIHDVLPGFDDELLDARKIPPDAVPEDGGWLFPIGFLAGLGATAGQLLTLSPTSDRWQIAVFDPDAIEPADETDVVELLRGALREDEPDDLNMLFWTSVATDDAMLRRPIRPLTELFDELGVVHAGDLVAAPGFDFGRWRLGRRLDRIQQDHSIDEDEALAVELLIRFHELAMTVLDAADDDEAFGEPDQVEDLPGWAEEAGVSRDTVFKTLRMLDSPKVAEAVRVETLGAGRVGAAAIGVLADGFVTWAPSGAQAALCWLRAKALERLGLVVEAEADLHAALRHDPEWTPALLDLANYSSDRGDASAGLALLRRAGFSDDDPLATVLRAFRPRARPGLGRNDRCWCGSGRKYKQCHLGNEESPIEERAAWLYQKAAFYLNDGPFRSDLLDVAFARSEHWEGEGSLWDAINDPVVGDAMLFEGGVFEAFVHERGSLLPADERLMADQWLLIDRSVFEVETTAPGSGITVRDIRTGDRLDVRERTFSRQARVTDLFCARIVPAGETMQIFGGIEPVALHARDALIALLDDAPDPVELVEFLSARFAPPRLSNTEGHEMVLCELSVRVPDPAALAAELDVRFDRQETPDDTQEWIEHVTTHGMSRIAAKVRLGDNIVMIDVNSNERADRILAVLDELQPGNEVIVDRRTPAEDLREAMSRSASPPASGEIDAGDPQVAELLDSLIRQSEQTWLDESIPALGGLTPRQAAADPTRRDELVRLLHQFDHLSGPGVMSAERLRAALDL